MTALKKTPKVYKHRPIWKSKRFQINVLTSITMLTALTGVVDFREEVTKAITIGVAFANIILQVWFNGDRR